MCVNISFMGINKESFYAGIYALKKQYRRRKKNYEE